MHVYGVRLTKRTGVYTILIYQTSNTALQMGHRRRWQPVPNNATKNFKITFLWPCKEPILLQKLPLLHIDIKHIIPDELHLLLRITDVLLKIFIATAVAHDKRTMGTRWKLKRGPMANAIIVNIRHCRIPFHIWDITTEKHPQDLDFVCFKNPYIDSLPDINSQGHTS